MDFKNAAFWHADLRGASFRGADLTGVQFKGSPSDAQTDLRGADFTSANLANASFAVTPYDCTTKWPDGFDVGQYPLLTAEPGSNWRLPTACAADCARVGQKLSTTAGASAEPVRGDFYLEASVLHTTLDGRLWHFLA